MAQLMIHRLCTLLFCVLAFECDVADGLFDWLKPTQTPPAQILQPNPGSPAKDLTTFEMPISDDKFLTEGKQMDLSPLGSCHFKVVTQLKSTCERLSEEQLAKLGVMLFNCQAQVEGRMVYTCTEEMTIKECTAEMDSDTWNAYHIVSNRARSVCYATRQLHFRRRAEITVNALISTASSQLDAMNDLKDGQLELKELTAASLDKLLQGHKALKAQQAELWEGQGQLESSLKVNLEQLGKEKALIASGQDLVARLIQDITHRMDNVSEQLKGQGSEVQENHKTIIQDLADVGDKAQDVYNKIDHSMSGLLQYQETTAQYYTDLMHKLEQMNGTLGVMLHYLDNMQGRIEGRLHLIQDYLGWAGLSLAAMYTCIVHAGYFLLGAVLLTFLRSPFFSRAMLLFTVPLNAVAEVNQQPALDFTGLSLLLLTLTLGHWFINQLLQICSRIMEKTSCMLSLPPCKIVEQVSQHVPYHHQSTPQRSNCDSPTEHDLLDNFIPDNPYMSSDQSPCQTPLDLDDRFVPMNGTPNQSTPRVMKLSSLSTDLIENIPLRNLAHDLDGVNDSRCASLNLSLASNSSRSGRQLCNGITKMGKACRKRAVLGQDYCRVHEGGYTSYVNL